MTKQKKLKILHIFPQFVTGGAERLVLHYATDFAHRGYEVHVVSTVSGGPLEHFFEEVEGIELFIGDREKQGGRLGVYHQLKAYVNRVQPDIIHTHLFGGHLIGYFLQKQATWPIKWIATVHNVKRQMPWLRRRLLRLFFRKVDRVVAVSKAVEEFVRHDLKVKEEAIRLLLNGIPLLPWVDVRTSLFREKKVQLATVGRITEQKGHIYLFKALAQIKESDWDLHIFGAGELEGDLHQFAHTNGIAERIHWHGVVPDVSEYYKDIDIVIQPSLWEGLSLVVMEAMTAGRAVVASEPAGEELIDHNETGFLVPEGDVHALALQLTYLFNHKKEVKHIAKNGRTYAKKYFSLEKNVSELEHIYQEISS